MKKEVYDRIAKFRKTGEFCYRFERALTVIMLIPAICSIALALFAPLWFVLGMLCMFTAIAVALLINTIVENITAERMKKYVAEHSVDYNSFNFYLVDIDEEGE